MSAGPDFAPIIRKVAFGGVMYSNKRYKHEALEPYEGQNVLLDMEVDVRTETQSFRIYDTDENEICLIEPDEIKSIGEVSHA